MSTRWGKNCSFYLGDSSNTGNGNFHLCTDTDDYDANKHVTAISSYAADPVGVGSDTGTMEWDTFSYLQSYTDPVDLELSHPTETRGSKKYIYANDTNPGMKGVINLLPFLGLARLSLFPGWYLGLWHCIVSNNQKLVKWL